MQEQNGQPKRELGETGSGRNSRKVNEENEMTTKEQNIQTGPMSMDQISGINAEKERGIEMLNAEKQNWLSRNLSNIVPVKLLAGLAVGAMLMTAIGLPTNGVSADEPSRPLGSVYYLAPDLSVDKKLATNSEFWGYGFAEDVVSHAKVDQGIYGFATDVPTMPKIDARSFGDAAGSPATAKIDQGFYGFATDVPTMPKIDARSFGNASDDTGNAKAEFWGYGSLSDIPTTNAKAVFWGYGSLTDVVN